MERWNGAESASKLWLMPPLLPEWQRKPFREDLGTQVLQKSREKIGMNS